MLTVGCLSITKFILFIPFFNQQTNVLFVLDEALHCAFSSTSIILLYTEVEPGQSDRMFYCIEQQRLVKSDVSDSYFCPKTVIVSCSVLVAVQHRSGQYDKY